MLGSAQAFILAFAWRWSPPSCVVPTDLNGGGTFLTVEGCLPTCAVALLVACLVGARRLSRLALVLENMVGVCATSGQPARRKSAFTNFPSLEYGTRHHVSWRQVSAVLA